MDNFYISLASNVNAYSRINKIGSFVTHLDHMYNLEGDWEVALTEVSFPLSFYNLTEPQSIWLNVFNKSNNQVILYEAKNVIPAGRYKTIHSLLNRINEKIQLFKDFVYDDFPNVSKLKLPKLYVDQNITKKVVVVQGENDELINFLTLDDELCSILGFEPQNYKNNVIKKFSEYVTMTSNKVPIAQHPTSDLVFYGKDPYDLSNRLNDIFIYTDLIEPTSVGNTAAPLLRRIHVHGIHDLGEQYDPNLSQIYYYPLKCNKFQSILIEMRDVYGSIIPFLFGIVNLTLHFRKRI